MPSTYYRKILWAFCILALISGGLLAACGNGAPQAPPQVVTVVVTAPPPPVVAPTPTAIPVATAIPSPTPTPTLRPTPTPTPRPTLMPVNTPGKRAETIITSLGRQVDVTVIGFDDSPMRFEQLVQVINEEERMLGVPYPSPSVTMNRVDVVSGGFCGENEPSYAPRYVGDPYVMEGSEIRVRVDDDCDETFATIAHETAHTWFHGNDYANWIDEGLANAVENQVVAASRSDQVIYPPVTHCESYRNLSELEKAAPERISSEEYQGFRCNYSLGDGVFGALREHYGDSEFNRRITRLARKATNATNLEITIENARKALGDEGGASKIIELWYGGQPKTRKYPHLDIVNWAYAPTIDDNYLHFAGKIGNGGKIHDFVLGRDSFCSQFVLYDGIGDMEWVGSVSGPLPAGWSHDEDAKVITVNHHIDPETGEFSVTAMLPRNALSGLGDLSLAVRSRVATGADGFCKESVTYSQVPVAVGSISSELKTVKFYHMGAVEWTFPPTIDGEYLHFAGKTVEPGMVHEFVLGKDPFCSQFSLYRGTTNQEWVGSVSDPLLVGWNYGEVPKLAVVNGQINSATGEFSVTAKINDMSLVEIQDLSLLVESRVTASGGNVCRVMDRYSQIAVATGAIPSELKASRHYHADAIEWTTSPTLNGNTLAFAGKAEPGDITLEWQDGYCSQFAFYEHDERGYHYIDSLNPLLPERSYWTGEITGEVTSYRSYADGAFEATAKLRDGALSGYRNPILVVREPAPVNRATSQCGDSGVLSAADIAR